MNCVIVDDDSLSRKLIEKFVEKTDFLTDFISFSSAIDAINYLRSDNAKADIIFLDIEMPEMNGVEFMQALGDIVVQVVVVSAKEKYALDAIEYDVTDYLLKPVTYARFLKAAEKAYAKMRQDILPSNSPNADFFIRNNGTLYKIAYNDVIWVESLENYIVINTFDDKYVAHVTMKTLYKQFPSDIFIRIHRSIVVNKKCIESIKSLTVEVHTSEGTISLPLSKSYRDILLKEINILSRE